MNHERKTYKYVYSWKIVPCEKCNETGEIDFTEATEGETVELKKIMCPECFGDKVKNVTDQTTEFIFKKVNLEFRAQSKAFKMKLANFTRQYTEQDNINILKFKNDTPEYKYWKQQSEFHNSSAVEDYILNKDNLKELFSLCLEGDLDLIDYSSDTEEKHFQLMLLGASVVNDFFILRTGSTSV